MTAAAALSPFLWPLSRLDEGVELLATRVATRARSASVGSFAGTDADSAAAMSVAFERALAPFALDVEAIDVRYDVAEHLPAPVVVRVPGSGEPTFLIVAGARRHYVTLLGLDWRWHSRPASECAELLRASVGAEERVDVSRLLDAAGVSASQRARVAAALLHEQLADTDVAVGWRAVPEPGSDFVSLLRRAGIGRQAALLVMLHACQFALWLVSWALVGRGALDGRTDWGWMTAWLLLLATIVPLQVWTLWTQGTLAIGVGRLLKERLLVGALRLDPQTIRMSGAGQLLGRVLESDAVESLAISGGLQAVLATIELVMAAGVLAFGAAGTALVVLLVGVVVLTALATVTYHRRRSDWSTARLDMTNRLVEHVAGHRTRLAQEERRRWHETEDRELGDYVDRSSALDRWVPAILVMFPRGWLALSIGVLAPSFVAGSSPEALAISVGGVLLASLALRRFGEGLSQLSGAAISWREAKPLFDAAAHRPSQAQVDVAPQGGDSRAPLMLDVRDVSFRYPNRAKPALEGCTLTASAGERLLIRGRSGGGKSTLASIVSGLREASGGLVLVGGLDRASLGAHGWRRRIVSAPQFHENHVFGETFAFNLLMGRAWPPTNRDLDEAEEVARELGLGDLLARMPAGLLQLVGEGGWQLSHGERSRLFMARALLQGGDVLVLDESFAALDPHTMRTTLQCVLRRAPTLMVIAHP